MAEIKVTEENFEAEVLQSEKPVLVDFWAAWCGPCQMMGPILSEIAETYDEKVTIAKIDVDENMMLARKYKIFSIPSMLLFKNGEVVDKIVGAVPKSEIVEIISK